MHFLITSWNCGLCHSSVKEGNRAILATRTHTHSHTRSEFCPTQICPHCMVAEPAFPYHTFCCAILQLAFKSFHKIPELFEIGRALAPTLPVEGNELALQICKASFSQRTLSKMLESGTATESGCRPLLAALLQLPNEILTNSIWPYITLTSLRYVAPIFGEMSDLIIELQKRPARSYQISARKAIFATRFVFGGTPYITSLCNNQADTDDILVKQQDQSYDYVVVWLNNIGITAIEFLPSSISPSVERKGEWAHRLAAPDEWIDVTTKGVFLERIADTNSKRPRILWDLSESPFLVQPEPPLNIRAPSATHDILLRYVNLDNACGISVAFSAAEMLAIMGHTKRGTNLSAYTDLGVHAVWTHCPLSREDAIVGVWGVYPDNECLRMHSLIITTRHKQVWLGPFVSPGSDTSLQPIQIACHPISAFYYSHPHSRRNHVVGAISPRPMAESLRPPVRPDYQAFGLTQSLPAYDWYYSEAPLTGVRRVQLCKDGNDCIGLYLHYDGYERTVGQFRFDKAVCDYPDEPGFIALSSTQHGDKSSVRVIFSRKADDLCFRPMAGSIIWWYGRETSNVSLI